MRGGAAGGVSAGRAVFRVRARYRFRLATVGDLDLLDLWLRQPQVREWWGEPEAFAAEDLADPRVTVMIVEGDKDPFDHHDSNRLQRIAEPTPNPLAQILARQKAK